MKKTLLFIIFLSLCACTADELTKGRSFYMGFTFGRQETFRNSLLDVSDIMNYHFDERIPWTDLATDDFISPEILADWKLKKDFTRPGHKVCVSVSPLSVDRDKLARDIDKADATIPGMDSISFADDKIKAGYLKYCKLIINYFKPDFFNMSAEANLLFFLKPGSWTDFIAFHEYIYGELKSSYPELVVFSSVIAEPALENYFPNTDYLMQRLPILQILENSDLYALSVQSNTIASVTGSKSDDALSELFNISKKPFALSILTPVPWVSPPVPDKNVSSQMDFHTILEAVLATCLKRHAVFVVSSIQDLDLRTSPNFHPVESEITTEVWRKYLSVDFN